MLPATAPPATTTTAATAAAQGGVGFEPQQPRPQVLVQLEVRAQQLEAAPVAVAHARVRRAATAGAAAAARRSERRQRRLRGGPRARHRVHDHALARGQHDRLQHVGREARARAAARRHAAGHQRRGELVEAHDAAPVDPAAAAAAAAQRRVRCDVRARHDAVRRVRQRERRRRAVGARRAHEVAVAVHVHVARVCDRHPQPQRRLAAAAHRQRALHELLHDEVLARARLDGGAQRARARHDQHVAPAPGHGRLHDPQVAGAVLGGHAQPVRGAVAARVHRAQALRERRRRRLGAGARRDGERDGHAVKHVRRARAARRVAPVQRADEPDAAGQRADVGQVVEQLRGRGEGTRRPGGALRQQLEQRLGAVAHVQRGLVRQQHVPRASLDGAVCILVRVDGRGAHVRAAAQQRREHDALVGQAHGRDAQRRVAVAKGRGRRHGWGPVLSVSTGDATTRDRDSIP